MVFEEAFLFSDTVRANIAYGRPDATDEQVRAAAEAAQVGGVRRRPARRLRHPRRRARAHAVRRAAPARRPGPGRAHRPARAGARRRHLGRRHRDRGRDPRHPARADRGPHHAARRAPALDAGAGRPDRRARRRPRGGRGHRGELLARSPLFRELLAAIPRRRRARTSAARDERKRRSVHWSAPNAAFATRLPAPASPPSCGPTRPRPPRRAVRRGATAGRDRRLRQRHGRGHARHPRAARRGRRPAARRRGPAAARRGPHRPRPRLPAHPPAPPGPRAARRDDPAGRPGRADARWRFPTVARYAVDAGITAHAADVLRTAVLLGHRLIVARSWVIVATPDRGDRAGRREPALPAARPQLRPPAAARARLLRARARRAGS